MILVITEEIYNKLDLESDFTYKFLEENNIEENELSIFLTHLKNSADEFDKIIRDITAKAEQIELEKLDNYQPTIL